MNEQEQRIAIAEACGWRLNSDDPSPSWSKTWLHPITKKMGYEVKDMPDYLNDLNAMHEAEKTLQGKTEYLLREFLINLAEVCCGKMEWYDAVKDAIKFVNATASQRAEAFLRTIGRWV